MKNLVFAMALSLFFSSTATVYGAEFKGGESIKIAEGDTLVDDLYSWSRYLRIDGTLLGSAFSGAQNITVDGIVTEDINGCSETLTINGIVKGDVRGFRRITRIYGTVGGDILAMGEEIEIGEDAVVHKNLYLGAGTIIIDGTVKGSFEGGAGRLIISGTIEKDVDIKAEEIEILPTARINGNFTYESDEELDLEGKGIVAGTINFRKKSDIRKKIHKAEKAISFFGFIYNLWSLTAAILVGAIIILISKKNAQDTFSLMKDQPLKSLGVGFLLTACIPAIILVLLALVLTIPVALITTALYLVLLYVSTIYVGMFVGDRILRFVAKKEVSIYLSLIVGLIILYLIFAIPFIGGILSLIVIFFGIGVIALSNYRNIFKPGLTQDAA